MTVAPDGSAAHAGAPDSEKALILIVDDDPRGLAALEGALAPEGYRIERASSGPMALEKAVECMPDVMLLDVMMPDMDGFDVCRAVRADSRIAELPVILVTALDDNEALLQGLDAGADELLTKPFNRLELRIRLRTLTRVNRYRRLVAERQHLSQTSHGVISVLTEILSLVDPTSFGLAQRVRERARQLGEAVGIENTWTVELAGLLSQVGAVTIPAPVLQKVRTGGALTPTEAEMLGRVPEIGRDLLTRIPALEPVGAIVLLQGARFDGQQQGTGTLRGELIPLEARVLKVALDLVRREAAGHSPLEAWAALSRDSGAYDPGVLAVAESLAMGVSRETPSSKVIAHVDLDGLRLGWRLHQDVLSPEGILLLGAGHVITPAVVERIQNFARVVGLRPPIVIERDNAPGAEGGAP